MVHNGSKTPLLTETISLNRLHCFGHVQRMEENRIPKKGLYINLETMWLRGRPGNRWQNGVREYGRLVGGKGWKVRVHNREEWEKLLRMTRNRRILHMPVKLSVETQIIKKFQREHIQSNLKNLAQTWANANHELYSKNAAFLYQLT